LQLRSLGARGGRADGRNLRARRARMATPPTPGPLCAPASKASQSFSYLDSATGI